MQMIEVKAADLAGLALDWAVAKAVNAYDGEYKFRPFSPSTDWSQGGPLLAKHFRIVTGMVPSLDMWPDEPAELLPWVMRKIVEFELGEVVSVPAEVVSQ